MPDQKVHTRSQMYWATLLKIPTQLIAFAISIVVARILMPVDFGIMGIAMMLIGFANLLTDFGLSTAIIQKQIRDDDTLQTVFTFNLALSTLLTLAFSLSSGFIAAFFRSPECRSVVLVMSSFFVITSFSAVPRAILRRDLDFKTLSVVDTGSTLARSVLTLALALAAFRYWALALGQLIPAALFTAYLCLKVRWVPAIRYRPSAMKQVMHFGAWNFVRTQLESALNQIDNLLLGRYSGVTALGFYDKARSTNAMPSDSFISSLNAVLFSSFSQRQNDPREVGALLKKGLMAVSVLSFPVYIGLCLVARYFVVGLMGEKWAPMVLPFQIIAASYSVKSLGGLLVSVDVAIGKYRDYTVRYLVAGCLFAAFCVLSLPYGAVGMSIAFLAFSVISVLLAVQLTIQATTVTWPELFRSLRPATLATGAMAATTWLLSRALPAPTPLNLVVVSVAGTITYGTCLSLERDHDFRILKKAVIADWLRLIRADT